jgi:large subunit ribosomal protein L21
MYAIVEEGGRQYKVEVETVIRVNRLPGLGPDNKRPEDQKSYVFPKVLLIKDDSGVKTGAALSGVKVSGEIVRDIRDKKVIVFKKKRRKGYHKKRGHRQDLTVIKITEILLGSPDLAKADAPRAEEAPAEAAPAPSPQESFTESPAEQAPEASAAPEAPQSEPEPQAEAPASEPAPETQEEPAPENPEDKQE